MSLRTAVILQARLDSSRLPGKALLSLGGRPLLFRVMEALRRFPASFYILASPDDCAPRFAPLAKEAGFQFVAGPKDDVLGRYCLAIRSFSVDPVIRATGDNPFVFVDAARAINSEALSLSADYAGYAGLPYGAGVESVSAAALLRAEGETAPGPKVPVKYPPEREHVCPYLYNHPELFRLHRPLAPLIWQDPSLRVTVDTREDYERCSILWDALAANAAAKAGPAAGEAGFSGEAIIAAYRQLRTSSPLFQEPR
jgi:spore coat polysaccharide biosynthesis protein SpsF